MKEFNQFLDSNTSCINSISYNNTSKYPFIHSVFYIVNFINPLTLVDEKLNKYIEKNINDNISQATIPQAGFLKGTFIMKNDFDESMEEFSDYM